MTARKVPAGSQQVAAKPSLRERIAQTRDSAGRFQRRKPEAETAAEAMTDAKTGPKAPLGMIPVSKNAHAGTYGLLIDGGGLGRHAPPGASVIVEPVAPEGAGLAVFYLKDRPGPVIFDLTHRFQMEHAQPVAPGSDVTPMIEICEPISGAPGLLNVDRIEKIHRVAGIYEPAEIMERWVRPPAKLPLMAVCPDDMGEHFASDTAAYPTVRLGETVIFDPAQREPTNGALCVLEWSNGRRSLLMTSLRKAGGKGEMRWWIDPINRPANREMLEQRLADNRPGNMLHTSDGPYTEDHLRKHLVGTAVGILAPCLTHHDDDEPRAVASEAETGRA